VVEKATTSSAGPVIACSDRRGGEDECDSSEKTGTEDGDVSKKGPLCYESG